MAQHDEVTTFSKLPRCSVRGLTEQHAKKLGKFFYSARCPIRGVMEQHAEKFQ